LLCDSFGVVGVFVDISVGFGVLHDLLEVLIEIGGDVLDGCEDMFGVVVELFPFE
jgi:hypothetical protein